MGKDIALILVQYIMADTKKAISQDRKRTNILRDGELALIAYLVERMPRWVTSNMLTGLGLVGNLSVAFVMLLAALYHDSTWLLLTPVGFAINWFGDSLDGRLAYYRNRPRKWFGFCLDIVIARRLYLRRPLWGGDDHLTASLQGHRPVLY